ncbi:oligosaccharide flippase family protein [Bacillus tianshenii]|nr:oligosaccharide flippase family protein [Bacillus tianshenii]
MRAAQTNKEFNSNLMKLLTGTTIAYGLPVAVSPILTRMYSPEEFGVVQLFIAITATLGSIANARYDLSVVLPEKDEDAIQLTALGVLISAVFSLFLFGIILAFHGPILKLFNNESLSFWLYFVPVAVFLIGLFNMLNFLNTRIKAFDNIAKGNVMKSVALVSVQLVAGFFKVGAGGLVAGQLASHLFGNTKLLTRVFSEFKGMFRIDRSEMKRLAKHYSQFPKYSMASILANNLSNHLISIVVSALYSVATLGFYSLVQRVLGMPSSLIGKSMSQVFYQKASAEKNETGQAVHAFDSTLKKMLLLAIPGFTLMFFVVDEVVTFVFGENWKTVGEYAKLLMPLFAIRFVVVPLTVVNSIFYKENVSMIWQFGLLALSLVVFGFVWLTSLSVETLFILYSSVISTYYVLFLFLLRRYSKGE